MGYFDVQGFQKSNMFSTFPKPFNNILRPSAFAVLKPVIIWQKIQYDELTQSDAIGQFVAVPVFGKLTLFKRFLAIQSNLFNLLQSPKKNASSGSRQSRFLPYLSAQKLSTIEYAGRTAHRSKFFY